MRIYVASSWRNVQQPDVVRALRDRGHDVYDFRNPDPGDHGFSWTQCVQQECCTPECGGNWGTGWTGCDHCHFRTCACFGALKDPRRFRDEILRHPKALDGFAKDMKALRSADATVLVLPCGRSAHLELGYAVGTARQKTIVLLDDPMSEPELMYLMVDTICSTTEEVLAALTVSRCPRCGMEHCG